MQDVARQGSENATKGVPSLTTCLLLDSFSPSENEGIYKHINAMDNHNFLLCCKKSFSKTSASSSNNIPALPSRFFLSLGIFHHLPSHSFVFPGCFHLFALLLNKISPRSFFSYSCVCFPPWVGGTGLVNSNETKER